MIMGALIVLLSLSCADRRQRNAKLSKYRSNIRAARQPMPVRTINRNTIAPPTPTQATTTTTTRPMTINRTQRNTKANFYLILSDSLCNKKKSVIGARPNPQAIARRIESSRCEFVICLLICASLFLSGDVAEREVGSSRGNDSNVSLTRAKGGVDSERRRSARRYSVARFARCPRTPGASVLLARFVPLSIDVASPLTQVTLTPANARAWVAYIAFHAAANELESARQIGQRLVVDMAIETQNALLAQVRERFNRFRCKTSRSVSVNSFLLRVSCHNRWGWSLLQSRLDVWVALINLELAFGTANTVRDVFERAVKQNDAETIYVTHCTALEIHYCVRNPYASFLLFCS
jgi:hypothetical protein